MNIARARELLVKAARELGTGADTRALEDAALDFAHVKRRNANRRDRWKVRKRLMISRGEGNGEDATAAGEVDGEGPEV